VTILVFTSAATGLAYRNCTDNELEGHWYQIDFYGYRNGEYTSLGDGTLFLAVIESGGTGYPILGYVYGNTFELTTHLADEVFVHGIGHVNSDGSICFNEWNRNVYADNYLMESI
jgi:hypothetical protein